MSAAPCGCDSEAGWVCRTHQAPQVVSRTPPPSVYATVYSALCAASNDVSEVLADIPPGPRYDAYRLRWARLDKAIDDAMDRLAAVEAEEARALADPDA